jgi:hypothetical protein
MCRQQELHIYEKPKGNKGDKVLSTVVYPIGYSFLPREGSLDDQDFLLMRYFKGFRQGEMQGAAKLMAKKGK